MEKLAIVGSGIAAMGCAHFLHKYYDITLFDKNNYVGGHTNTVYVTEGERSIPIDTGFIVCNYQNYPNLMKLFQQLNVPLKKSSMSFSAQIKNENIEYSGSSLNHLFLQRKNLFSRRYIRFLLHLNKFNKKCIEVIHDTKFHDTSIEDYIKLNGWSMDLLHWYLIPCVQHYGARHRRFLKNFPCFH